METEEGSGDHLIIGCATGEVPVEIGLIVGDMANCMRSALDYVVFALSSLAPDDKARRALQFPICDDEPTYCRARTAQLAGVDAKMITVIESVQPYKSGGADSVLAILRDINNGDKHRALRTTLNASVMNGFWTHDLTLPGLCVEGRAKTQLLWGTRFNFGSEGRMELLYGGLLAEEERVIARFKLGNYAPTDIEPNIVPQVVFGPNQPPYEGMLILESMNHILGYIETQVMPRFE